MNSLIPVLPFHRQKQFNLPNDNGYETPSGAITVRELCEKDDNKTKAFARKQANGFIVYMHVREERVDDFLAGIPLGLACYLI